MINSIEINIVWTSFCETTNNPKERLDNMFAVMKSPKKHPFSFSSLYFPFKLLFFTWNRLTVFCCLSHFIRHHKKPCNLAENEFIIFENSEIFSEIWNMDLPTGCFETFLRSVVFIRQMACDQRGVETNRQVKQTHEAQTERQTDKKSRNTNRHT